MLTCLGRCNNYMPRETGMRPRSWCKRLVRRFADATNSAAQRAIRPSFPADIVNRPPSFRVRGRREFEGDRKPTRILLAGAVVPFYGAVLASTE